MQLINNEGIRGTLRVKTTVEARLRAYTSYRRAYKKKVQGCFLSERSEFGHIVQ